MDDEDLVNSALNQCRKKIISVIKPRYRIINDNLRKFDDMNLISH